VSSRFLTGYLPYVLRKTDQTLSAPFYAVLNTHGIARSEWRVLAVLHDMGEMGVIDLAAAALSPQPTVTHAVRRLAERGLVNRKPGVEDKRQRLVSTTPSGAKLTELLMQEAAHLERDLLGDAGDLTDLIAQLQELTLNIEQRIALRIEQGADQTEEAV